MRVIVTGILLTLMGVSLYAQTSNPRSYPDIPKNGVVTGTIIDASDKQPMEFTSIAIYRAGDSTLVTGSITDTNGNFKLQDLPYGKFYLVANFMGYEKSYVDNVNITPENNIVDIGQINLRQASKSLEEVEVIADQAHVEYKLDRKVVNVSEDLNAATGTAAEVLQNTPSVTVDIEGNVSLRGSSNFQVLIDGKPTPLSGSDALQQIPASAIRSIEIITNPSAKYDPDGMAGIINIISKKNMLNGMSGIFNARLGTGNKYSGDFLLSYRTEKFNIYGGGSYRDDQYEGGMHSLNEIFLDDASKYTEKDGVRNMNRYGYEAKGGIDFYLNDKNTLSLSGEVGSHEFGRGGWQEIRYWNEPTDFNIYTVNDFRGTHGGDYYNLNLNYQHKFNDEGHELIAYANYSHSLGEDLDKQAEYAAGEDFSFNRDNLNNRTRATEAGDEDEFRAQVDYTLPISEKSRLEAGYQARIDNEFETFEFMEYDSLQNDLVLNPDYTNSTDFFRNIQALYTTYSNELGSYQFMLGLRGELTDRRIQTKQVEDPSKINRIDLFPTLHISRSFNNNHQLMLSYSRRIDRPRGWFLEPFESYIDAHTRRRGDPNLRPEYMNSYELGYQKTFGRSFIAFEAYYKNTVDKIDRIIRLVDTENSIYLYTFGNVAEDHSLGTELMVNYNQLKWLELNASTTLYRYRLVGNLDNQDLDRKSTNWDARLNATFNFSTKTRLQVQTFYNGPSVSVQGEREAFFFSNIALRHDFLDRKLSATLQVRDLFGTMKYKMLNYGDNFKSSLEFTREPRVIMLSLSYKLNNFKQNRREDGGDMDMGGGGEGGDIF